MARFIAVEFQLTIDFIPLQVPSVERLGQMLKGRRYSIDVFVTIRCCHRPWLLRGACKHFHHLKLDKSPFNSRCLFIALITRNDATLFSAIFDSMDYPLHSKVSFAQLISAGDITWISVPHESSEFEDKGFPVSCTCLLKIYIFLWFEFWRNYFYRIVQV